MDIYINEMWKCWHCDSVHDEHEDALACCAPAPSMVYVCDECEKAFKTKREAEEHLPSHEPVPDAFGLPVISKAELEAMGQQRLFGG